MKDKQKFIGVCSSNFLAFPAEGKGDRAAVDEAELNLAAFFSKAAYCFPVPGTYSHFATFSWYTDVKEEAA